MVTSRSAAGPTATTAEAVLLPWIGSGWFGLELSVAVEIRVPSVEGTAVTVAIARAPRAKEPKKQTRVLPLTTRLPCERLSPVNSKPLGKAFVTMIPDAALGPLLVTESV